MNRDFLTSKSRKRPYTSKELFFRVLWAIVSPFFFFSPRPLFFLRACLLRLFGAKIGQHVHIYNSARIMIPWNLTIGDNSTIGPYAEIYNLGKIGIGSNVTISQRAHLCAGTHDHTDPTMPLIKASIKIEDGAWICADAFIGPSVTVGAGSVVGARAVVTKIVEPWTIVVGNPARKIGPRILKTGKS